MVTILLSRAELVTVRLVTDWYPQPEHGGFYHALIKGYYREAGLNVEILPGGPTTFALPRVASGQAEFGMTTSDDILLGLERDIPVVAVGATMQHDPQGIMFHEGSAIRKFEDLEGRTIATTPGVAWFRYMLKRYELKRVKERPLVFSIAPFLKDTNYVTQCFVTSEPFFAEKAGSKPRVLLLQNSGYDPYRVFFTTRKLVQEQPAMVRSFVAASIRGWKDYLSAREAVHAELQKRNPQLDPEKMDFSWKTLKEGRFVLGNPARGEAVGQFSEARWKAQFEILKDLRIVGSRLDYSKAFITNFCNLPP